MNENLNKNWYFYKNYCKTEPAEVFNYRYV